MFVDSYPVFTDSLVLFLNYFPIDSSKFSEWIECSNVNKDLIHPVIQLFKETYKQTRKKKEVKKLSQETQKLVSKMNGKVKYVKQEAETNNEEWDIVKKNKFYYHVVFITIAPR